MMNENRRMKMIQIKVNEMWRIRETGKEVVAMNTHLDRWGELARRKQAALVGLSLLFLPSFFPLFFLFRSSFAPLSLYLFLFSWLFNAR